MNHRKTFKEWFWDRFEEWRKGTTNGPTAFARYLGIKQQIVSSWLDGKYQPKSMEHIVKLGAKYPEIYDLFDYPRPVPEEDPLPLDKIPADLRNRLETATREIANTLEQMRIDPESVEAGSVVREIMEKHGFVSTETK